MLRNSLMKTLFATSLAAVLVVPVVPIVAQNIEVPNLPSARRPGVFVTPVPNAPLTATVVVENTRPLPDGTTERFKTIHNIARDSRGRIYNENRQLVPESFTGTPQLLSVHIFDPETRTSVFFNPMERIARKTTLRGPAPDWEHMTLLPSVPTPAKAGKNSAQQTEKTVVEDLGTQVMENVTVHGERVITTVPATASGTGRPVVVTNEYWYSDELHLNMLIKHNDPRTGEQTHTITQVKRDNPDPQMFTVPSDYKVVDETPGN
jgi:hypothetical protein